MGHDWVQTPNIDKLVRAGVRFSNAYIAEPTCCPSRTAFFTGMHERVNGIGFTSSYSLNEEQWSHTYPALLRRNGYFTGFIGKFGVEYYTFKAPDKFDYWRGHNGWERFFHRSRVYRDCEQDITTFAMGESIARFLNLAPTNQPFCLSVSFSVPHGSQTTSMHTFNRPANENPKLREHPIYGDLYRDLDIAIPEDTGSDPYRHIPKEIMDQGKGRRRIYNYNYDRDKCREHHIRYYQQITALDKVVGDLVDGLEERGLDDDTVIIFASDHGLLMGEYGMGGKALLYDLAAKFPCFVYDPRLPDSRRGRQVHELVSSLDITSTILDYARVDQTEWMEGRSLRPLMVGRSDGDWRKYIFLENLYTGRDTPFSEGIRMDAWKYIRMFNGVDPYAEKDVDFRGREPDFEQLFNLEKDPAEKTNLIGEHECAAILSQLRRLCRAESERLNKRRQEYLRRHELTRR